MSLAFYMDEHVPKPITLALRIRGVDVLTTQEDDRRGTEDAILLDRATQVGRVMFSFDADMLRHTTSRLKRGIDFAGLVFAHPARISVGQCVRDIEMIAKAGEPKDLANQIVYLPL